MNLDDLIAIDVHVHLEHDAGSTDADAAARKYFGPSVAATGAAALSEYYRSRKMGFVVFTVDERLTGKAALDFLCQFLRRRAGKLSCDRPDKDFDEFRPVAHVDVMKLTAQSDLVAPGVRQQSGDRCGDDHDRTVE